MSRFWKACGSVVLEIAQWIASLPLYAKIAVALVSAATIVVLADWEELFLPAAPTPALTQQLRAPEPLKTETIVANQKEEDRVSATVPAAELPPRFTVLDPHVGPDGSITEGENGRPFMLKEIRPFSSKDVCIRADGERWACGLHAYATLRNSVVHKSLQCTNEGSRDDPRISCQIDGRNLALILISGGLAELKDGVQEPELLRAQGKAKAAKIGIWDREAQSTDR